MSEPFIGQITMFAGNFAPRGWATCDGQTLPINQNQALFSILGTTYGGDGRTSFQLPDLRGRIAMHEGQGPGLPDYRLGQKGGSPNQTLGVANIPSHTHEIRRACNSEEGTTDDPSGAVPAVSNENVYAQTTNDVMQSFNSQPTGGSQSFSIQNPYLAITFIIALVGIFPSRN